MLSVVILGSMLISGCGKVTENSIEEYNTQVETFKSEYQSIQEVSSTIQDIIIGYFLDYQKAEELQPYLYTEVDLEKVSDKATEIGESLEIIDDEYDKQIQEEMLELGIGKNRDEYDSLVTIGYTLESNEIFADMNSEYMTQVMSLLISKNNSRLILKIYWSDGKIIAVTRTLKNPFDNFM